MRPFTDHRPSVALITTADGPLGGALVRRLAGRGLKVGALGRDAAALEALRDSVSGSQVLPLVADLADVESLRAAFRTLDEIFGPVDTLINNSKHYPRRDFLETTPEDFMHTVHVNLGGAVACSMLALERMVPRGSGQIVNIGTFAGRNPTYLSSAYSVSMGALRILSPAMVRDLSDRFPDIVITEWIPGPSDTEAPDGTRPEVAADWGASLALWHDRSLNGAVFYRDTEFLSPLSFKRRMFNRLTGRKRHARIISP